MAFSFLNQELAIDLGTANTVIYQNGQIALDEPSIVAIDNSTGKCMALGKQAKLMHEKVNPGIKTIRPLKDGVIADFNAAESSPQEQKLYNLIWMRTVASQMADASVMNTRVLLDSDRRSEKFAIQATEVLFDGFLKLYIEGADDESDDDASEALLPVLREGDILAAGEISALCRFTAPPFRYSEATLVKKLEELGIGRPSTYSPPRRANIPRQYGY